LSNAYVTELKCFLYRHALKCSAQVTPLQLDSLKGQQA